MSTEKYYPLDDVDDRIEWARSRVAAKGGNGWVEWKFPPGYSVPQLYEMLHLYINLHEDLMLRTGHDRAGNLKLYIEVNTEGFKHEDH